MAFDTLNVLAGARRIPWARLRILAALLDFSACANAYVDGKPFSRREYRTLRRWLEDAGLGSIVTEFVKRLRALETNRPVLGGDSRHFRKVMLYREAIVRLSLGAVVATARRNMDLAEGIRATRTDGDLRLLFRVVMQCQIIDDVLDYATDSARELPSFLTAAKSLRRAVELTRLAALRYADDCNRAQSATVFPLRLALVAVSAVAMLVIRLVGTTPCKQSAAHRSRTLRNP